MATYILYIIVLHTLMKPVKAMNKPEQQLSTIKSYPLVNVYITMENHNFWWVNPLFLWPFSIVFCFETPRRHLRAAAHELWSEGHDQQCLALAALLSESFTIKNGGFHQRKLWISPAKMVSSPSKMVSSPSKMVSSPAKMVSWWFHQQKLWFHQPKLRFRQQKWRFYQQKCWFNMI